MRGGWKPSVGVKYQSTWGVGVLELSIIAGRRHFKPRTLDTLSTSDPLCILIIRLRCWHCAALIAHNAARLCNTCIRNTRNAQSSQIVHFSLCLVGPGPPHHLSMRRVASSCKATDWNFTLAASHRIMRHNLHNLHICTICTSARIHSGNQWQTIPHCRTARYAFMDPPIPLGPGYWLLEHFNWKWHIASTRCCNV